MTHRDPSEPSRLLEDLESIRTLLDEHADDPHNLLADGDGQLNIPLLQDVIIEPFDALPGQSAPKPTEPVTAARRPENPFLPYDSLARLAQERVQLDRLMAGHLPPLRESVHTGAREVRMEARLQAEAQLILQDVIDDMIPTIEAELRNRLKARLEQIVREQLK